MVFPTLLSPVLYDVTIAHPLAATYSSKYGQVGTAANLAGKRKTNPSLYVNRATELGMEVLPFAIETYGAWGRDAQGYLKRLCKASFENNTTCTAHKGGWAAPHLNQLTTQLVSVALVKGISQQLHVAHSKRHNSSPSPYDPLSHSNLHIAPSLLALNLESLTSDLNPAPLCSELVVQPQVHAAVDDAIHEVANDASMLPTFDDEIHGHNDVH